MTVLFFALLESPSIPSSYSVAQDGAVFQGGYLRNFVGSPDPPFSPLSERLTPSPAWLQSSSGLADALSLRTVELRLVPDAFSSSF